MFRKEDAQKIIQESQNKDNKTTYADEVESLKDFFRTVIGRPALEQSIQEPKDTIDEEVLMQNEKKRDQYYQDLLQGLTSGFSIPPGQSEIYTGPVSDLGATREELLQAMINAEQSKLGEETKKDLASELGVVKETEQPKLSKEEQDDIKIAEEMLQDRQSLLQKEQPKTETTGTTYTASSLYDDLKSKDEKTFNNAAKYLYNQGITRTEWGGNEPRFDFVAYSPKLDSSAFGYGQIVYSTAQKMLDKGFIKDKETQNFAKKMIAAQKLFKNMYDNKKKFDDYRPEKASNTKKAEGYLKDLGITRDKFLEYTKQGYFYPSNSKEAKKRIENGIPEGIPLEILGDNYKENYFNLYKAIIKEKLPRTNNLDNLLQDYHGGSEAADKAYSKKTQGFLNLMEE
tara:strand:- start:63 stop:1259 length:1197 start_codon:yes stop_codon:yes gene_type:complete